MDGYTIEVSKSSLLPGPDFPDVGKIQGIRLVLRCYQTSGGTLADFGWCYFRCVLLQQLDISSESCCAKFSIILQCPLCGHPGSKNS